MESGKPLTEMSPGDFGIISKIALTNGEMSRLRDLGLNEGVPVRVVRFAPMGDPMEIKFRGFHLSIRKAIAQFVLVIKNGYKEANEN